MPEESRNDTGNNSASPSDSRGSLPSISLPKGGGANRGIGEKFGANPVTGTGSLSVPIFTEFPADPIFPPKLSLNYDSGSSNGPFGLGWNLSVPSITRKTEKGLPGYTNAEDSDLFILSDAEDLIPALVQNGSTWTQDVFKPSRNSQGYTVKRLWPGPGGSSQGRERTNNATGSSFGKQ